MGAQEIRGTALRGDEPKRLQLSDGSRLMLDGQESRGRVAWRRLGDHRGPSPTRSVSVRDAVNLAGEEYGDYVRTRTRVEAEWMRAMSDWYRDEANRLSEELTTATA